MHVFSYPKEMWQTLLVRMLNTRPFIIATLQDIQYS
jgi:hypothetical protein